MFKKVFAKIREVLQRMNIIKGARSIWQGKDLPNYEGFYTQIETWRDVYSCKPPWLEVRTRSGFRTMSALNAAKVLCREMSGLTFSEQVDINLSDAAYKEFIDGVLRDNSFWRQFPQFLERVYAMGGGALSVTLGQGKIVIDYVDAECFAPVGWNNRRITDGAFLTSQVHGEYYYNLLRRETMAASEDGQPTIVIENDLYRSRNKSDMGQRIDLAKLYPWIEPYTEIKAAAAPLFAYLKPNIANYIDSASPLGVSIFAAAIDTLKALDIAFDSFSREFILGRKRIIVPTQAMRYVVDPATGKMQRYFDAHDDVYEAFAADDAGNLHITDNTVELRIDEHAAAINALLNILCFQVGLSAGSLSFDGATGLKTATEVISENSKTYRTKKDHQNLIREALEDMIQAVITLAVVAGYLPQREYEISIGFDDSIITDEKTKIDKHIKLTGAGLESKLRAVMEIMECTEEEAQAELERIKAENAITGAPEDWFGGGGD